MKKKPSFRTVLMLVTAVSITVTACIFPENILRIVPLYISLFIMQLQTKANRFCFLVGGVNAVLYAIVYFSLKLYGMALYALLVSCPLQVVTFFLWNRKAYGSATVLRRLSAKQRILWTVGFVTAWLLLYAVLSAFGSGYVVLDNTVTLLGIIGTVFSMLSLIEFPFLQIVSGIISCILYVNMLGEHPAQITYLIYTVYSLICSVISLRYMYTLYVQQKEEKANEACIG